MTGVIGADLDDLDRLAERLRRAAEQISSLRTEVERAANVHWVGRRADAFRQTWAGSHRGRMIVVSRGLEEAADAVVRHRNEQAHASGARTGSDSGPVGRWFAAAGVVSPLGLLTAGALRSPEMRARIATLVGIAAGEETLIDQRRSETFRGRTEDGSSEYDDGFSKGRADGSISAGAEASAESRLLTDGQSISAQGRAGAEVGLEAEGRARAEAGIASTSVEGRAFAGGEANATAAATVGAGGAAVSVGAGAFVGAKAGVNASAEQMGVGVEAGASAYAGIGIHGSAEAEASFDEVSVGISAGVALGLGAGAHVKVGFSPREATEDALLLLDYVW